MLPGAVHHQSFVWDFDGPGFAERGEVLCGNHNRNARLALRTGGINNVHVVDDDGPRRLGRLSVDEQAPKEQEE